MITANPCQIFNASCDPFTENASYWNTNFSLQEPNQTGVPGGGGHVVDVRANWAPCLLATDNTSFRLKGVLHMQSWGALQDEFCIGQCCDQPLGSAAANGSAATATRL